MKSYDKKELKRKEATERNEAWEKLSPHQQLAQLDARLGVGVGATKQRKRIQKQMEKLNES